MNIRQTIPAGQTIRVPVNLGPITNQAQLQAIQSQVKKGDSCTINIMKIQTLYKLCATSLTCFLLTSPLLADLQSQLLDCSNIKNTDLRLNCFDHIATKVKEANPQPNQAAPQEQGVTGAKDTDTGSSLKTPVQTTSMMGLPSNSRDKDTTITAKIIGEFDGWDRDSVFELDNGQVWRALRGNTRKKRVSKTLNNPTITIKKASLGSYSLRVEGVKGKVKVKRVK